MDVGATSLDKETVKIESSASHGTVSSDTNVQHISNSLPESVVTSRLSSLLSSLVAEPLAAAPRMPQQHSPRNANVEEKASLPQPLATPSFPVPPHIMGRNVNNPAADSVAHGRKLQKPRLGMKVPYRNLTSQIVTQDELAQELLERSLKKHPVRDIPEGGDLFFAIKLTQRLAHHLSPGNAQVSTASPKDQTPGKTSPPQPQSSSVSQIVSSKQSPSAETPAISDNKDLIAILEGDGDPDWTPTATSAVAVKSFEPTPPPSIPHITNVKLDPILEKELALKQLMEFQNNSRRRKSDKGQKPGEKPQRSRSQVKKEPINKENGTTNLSNEQVCQSDKQNSRMSNVLHSGISNNSSQSPKLMTKTVRKRKGDDRSPLESKKARISGKKNVQSKSDVSPKTDEKVRKKFKNIKNNNNNNDNSVTSSSDARGKGVTVSNVKATKAVSVSKPKKSAVPGKGQLVDSRRKTAGSPEGSKGIPAQHIVDNNLNKPHSSTSNQDASSDHVSSIIDDFPEFPRSFTTPIRTYSPKKRTPNTIASPKVDMTQNPSVITVETIKEVSEPDKLKVPEVPDTALPKQNDDNSSTRKKKDVKESVENKKRRMGEVDRLLMDEGAINLLYEAEHGESRRRSNAPEENETLPTAQKRILKSARRKKKDLLLKTRLVKNAVLRLSNSPSSTTLSASARITRRTDIPNLHLASVHQGSEPQRKLSLDSQESLRSPPPLTPNDPPSPQSPQFIYPARLPIPAEASRIIRRHSSSSNFSSRSASPNSNRIADVSQNMDNVEKTSSVQSSTTNCTPSGSSAKSVTPNSGGRKKGVPIFVRKPQVIQTYQGKKKTTSTLEQPNSTSGASLKQLTKSSHLGNKDIKTTAKILSATAQKLAAEKLKKTVVKKISIPDKLKLKAEMSKNFQKGFQSGKMNVKKSVDNGSNKSKKRDESMKEKSSKSTTNASSKGNGNASIVDEILDLSSCLAAAASAFAAEAQEAREESGSKKTSGSSCTSHTSSPCPSRSSKSPTPSNRTASKKEPRIAPPLSPNAATYSNLLKTLENETQKQRKKDGEEVTKQRSSVRQNVGAYHYKDISLRRYDNLVQVILTPQSTKMKNALNIQVLRELKDALIQLKKDETCRAVLITSTGSSFCQGIDFYSLLHTNAEKRKSAAQELAQALKEFMKSLALFSKPIVAGVHGGAVGLGVTMLPFFDMVFASDKATFYTPYAKLGQVPEGAAILTLPHMFGNAVTSELLFGCRKLTASEALHFGLVTRILWPDKFQEELIPIIRSMANQSSQSMESTKALLRHSLRTKLDAALESESHLLVQHWISAECQTNFKKFLDDEDVGLQKQRVEA